MTSNVTYNGSLRTTCIHLRSGNTIITDAPIDNNGKGEAFSPTDLVATALASCMITIMGIKARDMEVDITDTTAEITKYMAANPRKIEKVSLKITFPDKPFEDRTKKILEKAALTCPVALSLHPDILQDVTFHWIQ